MLLSVVNDVDCTVIGWAGIRYSIMQGEQGTTNGNEKQG